MCPWDCPLVGLTPRAHHPRTAPPGMLTKFPEESEPALMGQYTKASPIHNQTSHSRIII